MASLPPPSRISPSNDDARISDVVALLERISPLVSELQRIQNVGQFSGMRHVMYELLKSQGSEGAILNELDCPICMTRFDLSTQEPCVNSCGHTFCRECFMMMSSCGVCRAPKGTIRVNYALRNIIEKLT